MKDCLKVVALLLVGFMVGLFVGDKKHYNLLLEGGPGHSDGKKPA